MPLDYEVMEKVVGKDKQDKTENPDADDSENMEDISNG